jgi:hypothetical protein
MPFLIEKGNGIFPLDTVQEKQFISKTDGREHQTS